MSPINFPEQPIPYLEALMAKIEREAVEELMKRSELVQSIFPKFEALMGLGVYQDALRFVSDRNAMSYYRHCSDYVLCELFPEYAEACEAFYNEGGAQLKEIWSVEEAKRCERAMLCLLALALTIRNDNPGYDAVSPVRWRTVLRSALEMAKHAPKDPAPQ